MWLGVVRSFNDFGAVAGWFAEAAWLEHGDVITVGNCFLCRFFRFEIWTEIHGGILSEKSREAHGLLPGYCDVCRGLVDYILHLLKSR